MATKTVDKTETFDVAGMIDELAAKGAQALKGLEKLNQEQIDHIVHEMSMAALDQHMPLAKLAVEETGRGIYEDKAIKNMYASEYIWNAIKDNKTVGVINEDKEAGIIEMAEPVGVIWGVTPPTNPSPPLRRPRRCSLPPPLWKTAHPEDSPEEDAERAEAARFMRKAL